MRYLLLFLSMVFCLVTSGAYAGELTEERVKVFYEESAALIGQGEQKIQRFLSNHLHPDFVAEKEVFMRFSNTGKKRFSRQLTKEDFIFAAIRAESLVTYEDVQHDVSKIKIAPDGQSAQVIDTFRVKGIEKGFGRDGGMVERPFTATSECRDHVILDHHDIIQIKRSVCTTDAVYDAAL